MDLIFQTFIIIVSIISGGVASLSGFGIGSLLTPLFAIKTGISVAVASVAIAHFVGTLLRFIMWRKYINRKILMSFGITSALGGLTGAILHNYFYNVTLSITFGCLLIFAGSMEITGLSKKIRFPGIVAWIAGGLSGLFGGLVGNQGGIRSAALIGFNLRPKEFVATATGIALMVDLARLPIYIYYQHQEIFSLRLSILIAIIGVVIGTAIGGRILKKIPRKIYQKSLASIFILIGLFILTQI